jgi:guanylate kinase
VQGAEQVLRKRPDATVILLLPPSDEVQAERLASRGDDEEHIRRRLAVGAEEERLGRAIADELVVNDDIERAAQVVAGIIARYRKLAS